MVYVSDMKAAQESLARLKGLRAEEEARTRSHIDEMRLLDISSPHRERAEWQAFKLRVAEIEREIDVLTQCLADVVSSTPPRMIVS
jgi:hypothetical protein